jgi:hypothetical protein
MKIDRQQRCNHQRLLLPIGNDNVIANNRCLYPKKIITHRPSRETKRYHGVDQPGRGCLLAAGQLIAAADQHKQRDEQRAWKTISSLGPYHVSIRRQR